MACAIKEEISRNYNGDVNVVIGTIGWAARIVRWRSFNSRSAQKGVVLTTMAIRVYTESDAISPD